MAEVCVFQRHRFGHLTLAFLTIHHENIGGPTSTHDKRKIKFLSTLLFPNTVNVQENIMLGKLAFRISVLLLAFHFLSTSAKNRLWKVGPLKCGDAYGTYTYQYEPTWHCYVNFCHERSCSAPAFPQSVYPSNPRKRFALYECRELFVKNNIIREGPAVDVLYPTKFQAFNLVGQVVVMAGTYSTGEAFYNKKFTCYYDKPDHVNNARPVCSLCFSFF
ncbi:hypothetical protein O181_007731 [Austropuccinia psidii MF-1]|uniref:Uncharacterized protein n=1 Tax=Austropuccinia psidii MF-1 TaxID=1389203 RepID=A0A9Q3BLD0_9BASI|nr:hypothetical protein [Austropuccinia psidii MF-1]